jgi:hypothetical protein
VALLGYWLIFVGGAAAVVGGLLVGLASHNQSDASDQLAKDNQALLSDVRDLNNRIYSLNERNFKLVEKIEAYALGADSFIYFRLNNFGTPDVSASIKVSGEHPVRNAYVEVYDVGDILHDFLKKPSLNLLADKNIGHTKMDSVSPNQSLAWTTFPFRFSPEKTLYSYFLTISAENIAVQQMIQVELIDGNWKQAYVVSRIYPNEDRPGVQLLGYADVGFSVGVPDRISIPDELVGKQPIG